jgi:putative ABC transport system permease protein
MREWLSATGRDLGYALRAMRRAPGFAVAVVATIALGIGANTVVFSLLNVLLLRPPDAARPAELVRVYTSEATLREARDRFGASSYADYLDLARSPALAGLAAMMPLGASIELGGRVERVEGRVVSDNFLEVLGRPLYLGGWTEASRPGSMPEVVVSHALWTSTLARDPEVIGRRLVVNGVPAVIVGVTQPDFRGVELSDVGLYLPFGSAAGIVGRAGLTQDRGERSVRLLGRLAPGTTAEAAEASLNAIMAGLAEAHPGSNAGRQVSVRAARSLIPLELYGQGVIPVAGLLFGATVVMLALTGVNVAAMLLVRTVRRRRELAVRLSLGASPGRLARQIVAEGVVLATIAGAVVVALLTQLPALAASLGVPRSVEPTVDLVVLGYAALVALGFGACFGLVPAVVGMRSAVVEALRAVQGSAGPTRARLHGALVSAQIALSMVLLVVGAALLASLGRLERVDPGFPVQGLLVAIFEDPPNRPDAARERAFGELAVERLGALPGVASVSVGSMAPFTSDGARSSIAIPGYTPEPEESMEIQAVTAGPAFFRTLGIPIQRGRELERATGDSLARVVINEAMARRYWGAADPVGSFVRLGGEGGEAAEVIGVSGDARFLSLGEPPRPMYVVQRGQGGGSTVLLRTKGDPSSLVLAVRGTMARNEVPFRLSQLTPMEGILRESLAVSRAVSQVLLVLGGLAILLAAVGLYGVVSYVMTGRTREFGIRLALGATPGAIARLVLGYGLRLAVTGGMAGLLLGLGALRGLESLMFGSWGSAPLGLVVAAGLGVVTVAACLLPAARAVRVAPASALRAE